MPGTFTAIFLTFSPTVEVTFGCVFQGSENIIYKIVQSYIPAFTSDWKLATVSYKKSEALFKMWYNRNDFITFVLLSHKAETAWNSFIVAVRPVCNVMPENITAIVFKVVVAILLLHRVRLNIPVFICFRNARLLGNLLSV